MIDVNIIISMLTDFYFAKYLIIASAIWGIFKLIKILMIGR